MHSIYHTHTHTGRGTGTHTVEAKIEEKKNQRTEFSFPDEIVCIFRQMTMYYIHFYVILYLFKIKVGT